MTNAIPNAEGGNGHSVNELEILTQILTALRQLETSSQERMLSTVATFLGLGSRTSANVLSSDSISSVSPNNQQGLFSEDRSISAKQFMFEKQPKTDVEKVACLAYYLTHYRDVQYFKTLDISKLNTEAAQVKFANAAMAVDNATKRNYLVAASKGAKELSALGEQYVLALPDRDRARTIMEGARPRRRTRKHSQTKADD